MVAVIADKESVATKATVDSGGEEDRPVAVAVSVSLQPLQVLGFASLSWRIPSSVPFTFMALEGGLRYTSHFSSSNVDTPSSGRPSTSSSSPSNSKQTIDKTVVLGEEIRSRTVEKYLVLTGNCPSALRPSGP
jgi:hypothetical protein